ncbi:hypothetical protein [Streptomyces sp. NPDC056165]|uniref:hypothetical protein n=1 Tax=Streptomyces sp. NPDC056165 TaxID=3345733 RepID=UPI0035D55D1B
MTKSVHAGRRELPAILSGQGTRSGSQVPCAELAQRFGAFLKDLHPGTPLDFMVVGVLSTRSGPYLGHHDPSFTLRTYTHLMPNSEVRGRVAVDRVFRNPDSTEDGPETVHGAG